MEVIKHVRLKAHFLPMTSTMRPNPSAPILFFMSKTTSDRRSRVHTQDQMRPLLKHKRHCSTNHGRHARLVIRNAHLLTGK
jgi:hypothetical protein